MPQIQPQAASAAIELLLIEVAKLLNELEADARAHGFDVMPYLDKLAELSYFLAPSKRQTIEH